ncbi:MAG: hypothetical protein Q7S28_00915, partial [bacterium]|nr:hypothetical protein [bacterium]
MELQGTSHSKSSYEPHFDDPRLRMTVAGRGLVRVVSAVSYIFAVVAAVTFLLSDVTWLRGVGIFIVLVILDRVRCLREADVPLSALPLHGPVPMEHYLAPAAFRIVERGYDKSVIKKTDVGLEIIGQFVGTREAKEALRRLDVSYDEFAEKLESLIQESRRGEYDNEARRATIERIMVAAFSLALENRNVFIQSTDIFAACAAFGEGLVARLFVTFSIDPGDLERALLFSVTRSRFRFFRGAAWGFVDRRKRKHRIMNRAWTSRPTPTLDRYGVDYTDLARQESIGLLIGHAEEYERIIETLGRPINPNALLVGEAGIGKETIVSHLAYALAKDKVPPALFDRRLVSIELNSLVAGATPDELHARIQTIIREIEMAGNVVLYLPDIHNLLRTSGTAYLSAADAIMPVIMNNAFPIVGATYPREFKTLIEPRSDFVGSFEVIRVEEISEADAAKLLVYESVELEQKFKCIISFGAIKTAVQIAKKYFHTKYLPSSAEELLKATLVAAERRGVTAITPQLVIEVAEEKVNIPLHEAEGEEAEKLLNLEGIIHERLIGQEEAVKAVANALREYRSGLSRQGGPIANFLFVGPTGVGKTELAKILAKIQFGS